MRVVSNGSKILIWKQITTSLCAAPLLYRCFQWFKDTNLKANHNEISILVMSIIVVSNGSKILIWKQITTGETVQLLEQRCFQWFKDTNLKANHNSILILWLLLMVVSNGSKILIWKQITTLKVKPWLISSCFQWFKDTNLKANHNFVVYGFICIFVVSNGSKILIWKQITTIWSLSSLEYKLFPMVQRY